MGRRHAHTHIPTVGGKHTGKSFKCNLSIYYLLIFPFPQWISPFFRIMHHIMPACVCVFCIRIKESEKGANETADECVCGWSSKTRGAQPWRLYTASISELLKATRAAWMKSQYSKMKKLHGGGKRCPTETCWRSVDGPGCSPLQSNSFTRGNIHETADSPNEVSIDLNSWKTKARSDWSERKGLESNEPAEYGHLNLWSYEQLDKENDPKNGKALIKKNKN